MKGVYTMESSMIPYRNSGIGWTNDWYDKVKIDIPRVYHRLMSAEFIRRVYGNIVDTNSNEDIVDDPIDDDI